MKSNELADGGYLQVKKKKQHRYRQLRKIGLLAICLLFLFSACSMIAVKYSYDGHFPRYDRPDGTITANLQYEAVKEDYPRERVSFLSGKNTLQGYVYGEENDRGVVVVAHGLGGGADSYLPHIIYFVDNGWKVFAYDATGSFDSEGKTTKGFPQALLDLDSALAYIGEKEAFANLPILLFGHSWGGYAVANAPHLAHPVAGIVSISGPNSPMDIVVEQGRRIMGDFVNVQIPYLWFYQRILFGEVASLTAADAITQSDVPILIIHGTEDELVTYEGSSIIANIDELANPNVTERVLTERGHNDIFRSERARSYVTKVNKTYRALYNDYNGVLPYSVQQGFYAEIDRPLAQELDQKLMEEIHSFFVKSIETSQ